MVFFKSLWQALAATAAFYFFLFWLQAQGVFAFTAAFYTVGGFIVTVVFIMLNFTLIWNWE